MVSATANGQRWAWEIVHHCRENICANAAKVQNKGFSQVIFLCSDYNIKQAVHAKIRNAGFDPDFLAMLRYRIFSNLICQRKEAKLRGTR